MERQWLLGEDLCLEDSVLDPITFEDLVLMAQNINPESRRTLRDELQDVVQQRIEDCFELFDRNEDAIYEHAFPPEPAPLTNAPGWDSQRLEDFAQAIYKWLLEHELWQDVYIYYDGKCMGTSGMVDGKEKFRYNGEPFIETDIDPRKYFEYVADPHILSMSFEGPFYEIINGTSTWSGRLIDEFDKLCASFGCWYEQGHAWNLSMYEG